MIPKAGNVKYRNSRNIEGKVKSIAVSKKCGRWYVSVLTEQELTEKEKTFNNPIGIDLGIKTFAFLSNGKEIENPHFYRKLEQKLKTLQRKLSSKVKFSKNWLKQKLKVSRLQEHIAHCRYDFLHKKSHEIVKNQDLIGIEDLNVKGMVKNKKLAKSIHDVGWGKYVEMLEYKIFFQSKTLIKVGRFYPSSQLCSNPECDGKKLMPLHLRTYMCERCHSVIDRDYNASKNIEIEAIRLCTAGHAGC
jgi:putative transposase